MQITHSLHHFRAKNILTLSLAQHTQTGPGIIAAGVSGPDSSLRGVVRAVVKDSTDAGGSVLYVDSDGATADNSRPAPRPGSGES